MIIVSLLVLAFLPPIEKYKIELADTWIVDKDFAYSYFRNLNHDGKSEYILSYNREGMKYFLITEDQLLYRIKEKLEPKLLVRLSNKAPLFCRKMDIDLDGENEYLFKKSQSNQYTILRNNFRHPVNLYLETSHPFYFKVFL